MATSREADFDAVFQRGYSSLVRALTAICGDRELAADCVQDAFCKAYARWGKISRFDQPIAWVRHVALNSIRDDVRRRNRSRKYLPRIAQADIASPPDDPAGFELVTVLSELPKQQRVAAALFYIEQLSVAEVAEAMGLSAGAVKFHLHAARENLRIALAHHDPKRDAG